MTSSYENTTSSDTNYGGSSTVEEARVKFGQQYTGSVSQYFEGYDEIFQKGDPCSSQGKLGEINNSLQKLFVVLRGVQKYGTYYINGAANAVANLKSTIYAITGVISGVLKSLVQRLRNWVLNKIKSIITYFLEVIMTNFLRTFKESIVAAVIDQIFCAFEKIIKGLFGLVGDFLYSLIGQIVQTPFCAMEQWTNALINRLVGDIDKVLGPIFEQIQDIIDGVGTIFGSVSSAIDTILGFQGFLCGGPECPEIKEFSLSPWGGPTKTQKDNFSNFNFGISSSFPGEITKTADEALNDFFGEDSNTSQSPGQCYTGNFECGLPQVVIFGGGGSGAVAEAVVNNVGQVIGTNLLSKGSGYTSPPFVQVIDPAGCGSNASGFIEMETDDEGYETGKVGDIIIENPGGGYDTDYVGGAPIIQQFYGTPNPVSTNMPVILNWEVDNADKVYIKGNQLYSNLPLIGNLAFPILETDVSFDPGQDVTTKTITLVAQNNNKDSTNQQVEQDLIITVQKGEVKPDPLFPLPPEIKLFKTASNEYTAVPGELITLVWNTLYSEKTTIDNNLSGSNESFNTGEMIVPQKGALTVVIPQNLVFPTNGAGVSIKFTLTVENDDAIASQNQDSIIQTASQELEILISQDSIPGPPGPEPEPEPEPEPDPDPSPNLSLQKIILSNDGADEVGDVVSYSIRVSNTGNQDLTNVTVTDPLTNFSTVIQTLAVNAQETFTTNYILTQNDIDSNGEGNGKIENTASAISDQTDIVISSAQVALNIPFDPGDPLDPSDPFDPGDPFDPEIPGGPGPEDPGDGTTPGGPGDGTTPGGPGNGGGNNDSVAIIDIVDIIDTGIGYEPGDTVTIDDGDGGEFEIDVNPIGQIVDFNIIESGYGYTTIPNITINSNTGAGAAFRARLRFIPLNEFEEMENTKLIDPNKLVQVIDCVGKTRPVVGYINGEPYYGPFHYHPSRGVKMTGAVHRSTPHEIIYDTVLESLENIQRIMSNASAPTTPNTSTTQNTMDTSSSFYGTSTPSNNTTNTVTTTTTTPSSSSSGSSGSSSSSSSGSSGSSSGGSYGY